ncbi:cytochrome P450 [Psychromarinibacter sp. C21-152]|uniref:Cytochrome P450 n=1 Tax=Psychromarinibacter sediminicola TaxID=3033385 RepID=A0AAE3T8S3_9RHOB|nr:cytochrome P450 [Psychromarinibacter sediminicola]MDF0601552.1 cytochrome P450 [Psychromarinibacter sediminicola]
MLDDITAFDLLHVPADYAADPYPYLARLRETAPVHRNPDGTYVLTRYDDLVQVYRDPKLWSSDKTIDFAPKFGPGSPLYEHHTTSVVFTDPPDHTRIRALFQHAFTRKALNDLKPRIESLVDTALDRFEDEGRMEVVEDFSFRLPIEVVCDMLGVPTADRGLIRDWAVAILTALEPKLTQEQLDTGNRAVTDFKQYLRDLLAHRRAHPETAQPGEVLTVLADAEADGERLTEIELLHQCIFMLNAGHETSTNMISHGIHEMLRNPDQIARLNAEPELIDPMVEEVLRYQAPIQINNRRATADTRIGDTDLPAGSIVHMIVAAANRDPAQFPDPDRFDIARRPNRHLSFALGIHICAGNNLARVEAVIAFGKLFRRFPKLELLAPAKIAPRLRFREVLELNVATGA